VPIDQLLDDVRRWLAGDRQEPVRDAAARYSGADWAAVMLHLDPAEIGTLVRSLPDDALSDALAEMDPIEAAGILRTLSQGHAVRLLETMEPDEATDLVVELPPAEAEHLLVAMEPEGAADIRDLLAYPPDSAGGIMTPAFVAVSPDLRAREAIAALRRLAAEAETINDVYVLDRGDRLIGVLSLRSLVLCPPETPVRTVMEPDAPRVEALMPAVDAARLLRDRNLLTLPVVDAGDHLLGIITADDALDVIEDELTEDILRLAGTDAEEMARRNPVQIARLRLPWLLGTMVIELGAGLVIARFDQVLTEVILLASFMPVISAVSGNVGLQAAAIVVRGLDTGHVRLQRWGAQLRKELATALLMAVTCGIVLGTVGAIWSRHWPFGVVIGGALICSMLTAGLMGTVIPMLSRRLGFDPATTAGPFETAFQDVVGFAVFLWLASLMVDWLR
jgi:magnesium transporter